MLFIPLLSLVALFVSFYSGSELLFAAAVIVATGLQIVKVRATLAAERRMCTIARILSRGGFQSGTRDIEQSVRGLLWQSQSYQGLGIDLSNLSQEFTEEFTILRAEGVSALQAVCQRLLKITRCTHAAIVITRDGKLVEQFESGSEVALPNLAPLIVQLQDRHLPLECLRFDIDGSGTSSFVHWEGSRHLLFSYQVVEGEKGTNCLSMFLGYPTERVPLPREKEILVEVLRMAARAVREQQAVSRVSAEALAETKRKEEHFAHISHDIRTPLNNVQAILDLFYLEGITEDNRDFLQVARANCRSLRDLVEELLEFTKYKNGKLSIEQSLLRVESVVGEVLNEFRLSAELKGLSFHQSGVLVEGIRADRKHLKRILMNLVSNAIKYTEHGAVTVALHENDGRVSIEVRDTGIGISKVDLPELFEPFSRIGEMQVEGIGLGLPLTKILVEANGGRIQVDSQHGRGSVFTISFPSAEVAEEEREDPFVFLEGKSEERSGVRVLLVDDDPDATRTLGRLVAQYGYEVQSTNRIEDLKGLLSFWKPSLILSDVEIPGGGIERVIAQANGVPVLAVTGCVDSAKLQSLQVSGVLRKPIDPQQLVDAIEEVLNGMEKQCQSKGLTLR
ncbi:MAG: hybrid sensor histidine kinase/response regulator [Bdellovibrionales bacterium]|nr:hybrid sensor histidine kinase/response regulator [Bdellovibrionales bacterium]